MEKIENLELNKLLEETSVELVEEKRKGVKGIIKSFLLKAEELAKEIKELQKQENKKQKSLDETLEKVNKIRLGDWSILQDKKTDNKPQEQENQS